MGYFVRGLATTGPNGLFSEECGKRGTTRDGSSHDRTEAAERTYSARCTDDGGNADDRQDRIENLDPQRFHFRTIATH